MKAKVKKTGEIVQVFLESQHCGNPQSMYKEAVFVNARMWHEDELLFIHEKSKEKGLVSLDKVCKWLKEQEEMIGVSFQEDFYERFRKAMEE